MNTVYENGMNTQPDMDKETKTVVIRRLRQRAAGSVIEGEQILDVILQEERARSRRSHQSEEDGHFGRFCDSLLHDQSAGTDRTDQPGDHVQLRRSGAAEAGKQRDKYVCTRLDTCGQVVDYINIKIEQNLI